MFLEISQNSEENIWARVSFLIKLQGSCLQEHLRMTASNKSSMRHRRFYEKTHTHPYTITCQRFYKAFNDTHREKLVLYWIQYKNSLICKVGCFWRFSYVYPNNLVLSIPLSYRCLKNVIHQVDSKNEWLLLSVTFTAKFELVFVLTFENAFS